MSDKMQTLDTCSKKILAVRDALEIFSGKCKIPIIGALIHFEEARFKDLQNIVGGITSRMLSKELKELEINLLITRKVIDTRPVTVKYKITTYGKSCQNVIFALYEWGENHRTKIIEQE